MKVNVIYKKRHHSYDADWLEAFANAGFNLTENVEFADLTIFHHSWTAQEAKVLNVKPTGKVLVMVVNEFKLVKERILFAKALNATIATQLTPEDAKELYGRYPHICIPHAMNPSHQPHYGDRQFTIGCRGAKYKITSDEDRNKICNPRLWSGLSCDVELGKIHDQKTWMKLLRTWKVMPSCEGGDARGKIITPRHFEATAALTGLVMYSGRYNDILNETHYIKLNRDHSNIQQVKQRIVEDDIIKMASLTREYLADCHTHQHRIKTILDWAKEN